MSLPARHYRLAAGALLLAATACSSDGELEGERLTERLNSDCASVAAAIDALPAPELPAVARANASTAASELTALANGIAGLDAGSLETAIYHARDQLEAIASAGSTDAALDAASAAFDELDAVAAELELTQCSSEFLGRIVVESARGILPE